MGPWLVSIVLKISPFTAFVLAKLLYNEMTTIVLYHVFFIIHTSICQHNARDFQFMAQQK